MGFIFFLSYFTFPPSFLLCTNSPLNDSKSNQRKILQTRIKQTGNQFDSRIVVEAVCRQKQRNANQTKPNQNQVEHRCSKLTVLTDSLNATLE